MQDQPSGARTSGWLLGVFPIPGIQNPGSGSEIPSWDLGLQIRLSSRPQPGRLITLLITSDHFLITSIFWLFSVGDGSWLISLIRVFPNFLTPFIELG